MANSDGGLDNPFLKPRHDQEKPELGDVEPSLPYSYFVARNPQIGDKKLVDFLIEEEMLDTSGKKEHHDKVRLPEGELPWDDAVRSHMDRIFLLFKTLDTVVPEGTPLLPADWGIIVHMLRQPLATAAANLNREFGEKLWVSTDSGSRMCEWLYIHYILNTLEPQRKEEIYTELFALSPQEMFPSYEIPPAEGEDKIFPMASVAPVSFFNRMQDKLTDEENAMVKERLESLHYRQINRTICTIPAPDIYAVCPELAKYHVNFTEEQRRNLGDSIAHNMNQSTYKQMYFY